MKRLVPDIAVIQRVRRLPVTVKILGLLALVLGLSLLLTGTLFDSEIRRYQENQQQQLGQQLGKQAAQIAATQILAKDWVSLSVTANQLIEHPQISGVEITDSRQQPLAQAGSAGDAVQDAPIVMDSSKLGQLRLHLAAPPLARELSIVFYRTTLAALISALLCWLVIFLYVRRLNAPLRQLQHATDALRRDQPMARLAIERDDELGLIAANLNQRFAPPKPEPEPEPIAEVETKERSEVTEVDAASGEADVPSTANPEAPAPLPAPTHYLLYVDHYSTASDNLTADERARLLEPYKRSLEQVSALYKGELATDEDGNWWVGFNPLDQEQSHGINALCAAQLFNALYRGTNQRAIRQMSPVANIKMALLCGEESFEALLEEAPMLCRAVEANNLIVDEQLFQVPQLERRLLAASKSRALEQPARLLNSLAPDYQALIEQQAAHFLNQA